MTTVSRSLQRLQETYKLRMQRDRWLAVEAWSVYLPGKFVRIDAEKSSAIRRLAPFQLDGDYLPYRDEATPNLDVLTPWLAGKFDNRYLTAVPLMAIRLEPYRRLNGTPEQVMTVLEADEQQARKAFQARNDYDMAHSEHLDYEKRLDDLQTLEQQQGERMRRLEELLEQRKQVFPELNAARKNVRSEAARLVSRAGDSLLWEITRNYAVDKCKELVSKVYHGQVASLDLTDEEIFAHYNNQRFNIFSLPDTISHVRDIKSVQDDIITLLKQDQNYARTAVRLAAHGDPVEIRNFVGEMFSQLDKDGSKLVDDALSATSTMPEPVRTLAVKYFTRKVRKAAADD